MINTLNKRIIPTDDITLPPCLNALADPALFGFSCTAAGLDRLLDALAIDPKPEPVGAGDDEPGDRWDGLG